MIRVSLHHSSIYRYDRVVELGPHAIRLRPTPHCRTPIRSYALQVLPPNHLLHWQQDPHGNSLARVVFRQATPQLQIDVRIAAEITGINPFDFLLEPHASVFPLTYDDIDKRDLQPFLSTSEAASQLDAFVSTIDQTPRSTIDFLVDLNCLLNEKIHYTTRLEPGVQGPDQTLSLGQGSCRDSAWLLALVLRKLGLAARFVSGYLVELKSDEDAVDGEAEVDEDSASLHAWAEVYLPGAGWVGLDPTSALLTGEQHIPLACASEPTSAAPISGTHSECNVKFEHHTSIERQDGDDVQPPI